MVHTEGRVTVVVDFNNPAWLTRLMALGKFLQRYSPNEGVHVYAYEPAEIGGVRITEISFVHDRGGSSYMRGDETCAAVILGCEQFLETHGDKPVRPAGWESFLNIHGEARVAILRGMGLNSAADAEYAEQLKVEHALAAESAGSAP